MEIKNINELIDCEEKFQLSNKLKLIMVNVLDNMIPCLPMAIIPVCGKIT